MQTRRLGRWMGGAATLAAVTALALARPAAQAQGGTTAFTGARVIVGDASRPIENATVHQQVLGQIMLANLNDEAQSWYMDGEGVFTRVDTSKLDEPFSAHVYFMRNPSLSGRGRALKGDAPAAFDHVGPRSSAAAQ